MAGYNLHIERLDKIEIKEWTDLCAKDNSLTISDTFEATNPETKEKIVIQTTNSCVWTSPILKRKFYFTYSNGKITFGSDKGQLKKAKKLAALLNAEVIGDEGEKY